MRTLVLSDLHSNVEALDAVMADAARVSWDRFVILGDLVGYGADPNQVLDRVRELAPTQVIRGNHDKVVAGITDGEGFNPLALAAARWTQGQLRVDNRAWLEALDAGPIATPGEPEVVLCHGSPIDEETYIFDHQEAREAFEGVAFGFCLFGHTHYPMVISLQGEDMDVETPGGLEGESVRLEGERHLINPGSVGQPRDGNFRPSYLVLDTGAGVAEFRRVTYPVEQAMAKIAEAGLPAPLALRLSRGV